MYCLMLFDRVIEYLLSSEAIRSSHNSVAMYYQHLLLRLLGDFFVNMPCIVGFEVTVLLTLTLTPTPLFYATISSH